MYLIEKKKSQQHSPNLPAIIPGQSSTHNWREVDSFSSRNTSNEGQSVFSNKDKRTREKEEIEERGEVREEMARYPDKKLCEEKKGERRRKDRTVEGDGTREEKPTNDWSNWAPEWYRAWPIGIVDHLWGLVPFIDQVLGLRGPARERIGRSLSIHPFSALPSCTPPSLVPFSRNVVCKRHGPWRTRNDRPIIHAPPGIGNQHALLTQEGREIFGPAEYWRIVFLDGDGRTTGGKIDQIRTIFLYDKIRINWNRIYEDI